MRGEFEHGIHDTARVDPTAEVVRSVVGRGTVVGPHASIFKSIVMDGVRVGTGAVLVAGHGGRRLGDRRGLQAA